MSLHRAMSDLGMTPGHQPRMSRPSPVSLDRAPAPPLQLSLNFTTINPERPSGLGMAVGLDYYATDKFRSDYFLRMGLTLSASTRDKIKPGSRELDSHSRFLVTNITTLPLS